jgi:hypothetical protein
MTRLGGAPNGALPEPAALWAAACNSLFGGPRAGARGVYEPVSDDPLSLCERQVRGSKRAANVWNHVGSTMRNRIARKPKSRMNRAIPRQSSPIVVTFEPACHAGGRGFESRRFRKNPCKSAILCCHGRRQIGADCTGCSLRDPKRAKTARNRSTWCRFQADSDPHSG